MFHLQTERLPGHLRGAHLVFLSSSFYILIASSLRRTVLEKVSGWEDWDYYW